MGSFQVCFQLCYDLEVFEIIIIFICCLPLPLFLSWNTVRLSLWVRGYVLWIRFLCCFWDWLSLSLQDCLHLTQDYPACSQRWRDARHWVTEHRMCLPVWCKKFLLTQELGIFGVFVYEVFAHCSWVLSDPSALSYRRERVALIFGVFMIRELLNF